jgi:hypothetical protein
MYGTAPAGMRRRAVPALADTGHNCQKQCPSTEIPEAASANALPDPIVLSHTTLSLGETPKYLYYFRRTAAVAVIVQILDHETINVFGNHRIPGKNIHHFVEAAWVITDAVPKDMSLGRSR